MAHGAERGQALASVPEALREVFAGIKAMYSIAWSEFTSVGGCEPEMCCAF